MSRIRIELRGVEEVAKRLLLADRHLKQGVAAGVYALGENIRTESMRRTPVDQGVLRASHYVTPPEQVEVGRPTVRVGCGGGAAKPYALIQHERLDFHHAEGEAKFLENAAKHEAQNAARTIGKHARAYLQRVAKGGSGGS